MNKKLFNLCLLVFMVASLIVLPLTTYKKAYAAKNNATYAYIDDTVILYSIPQDNIASEPITSLPATYFVEILDTLDTDYKVAYHDIVGLVDKANVTVVDYIPKYKYGTQKIKLAQDILGLNIRSIPNDKTGTVLYTATQNETNFIYYGSLQGSSPIANIDKWHFVRLVDDDNNTYYGYVYSIYTIADTIPNNVIEPMQPDDTTDGNVSSVPKLLQGTTLYIFIGAISLPVLFILYLLFKKKPQKPQNKN